MNNAQYLGMATDAVACVYGADAMAHTPDIERICVQYRSQARLGDTISPVVYGGEGDVTVSLNDGRGDPYAVVRLETRAGHARG